MHLSEENLSKYNILSIGEEGAYIMLFRVTIAVGPNSRNMHAIVHN